MPTGDGDIEIDVMPMIADASFSFGDSTNSNSTTNIPIPKPISKPSLDPKHISSDPILRPEAKSKEQHDLEEENIILKSALYALESAAARIKDERDTARQSEESLQAALKNQRWEVARQAIKDEIERTREYREDLGRWKIAIELCNGGNATGGGDSDQTSTPTQTA